MENTFIILIFFSFIFNFSGVGVISEETFFLILYKKEVGMFLPFFVSLYSMNSNLM